MALLQLRENQVVASLFGEVALFFFFFFIVVIRLVSNETTIHKILSIPLFSCIYCVHFHRVLAGVTNMRMHG